MKGLIATLIGFYKRFISPLLPPACRYSPTCSIYMLEAIREWGILRGGWMGFCRLLRCNPWSEGGWDPVPGRERKHRI